MNTGNYIQFDLFRENNGIYFINFKKTIQEQELSRGSYALMEQLNCWKIILWRLTFDHRWNLRQDKILQINK